MILTHVFSRITCRWSWKFLSTPAWSAMAHYKAIAVLACVGIGWITYGHLPEVPELPSWRPSPAVVRPETPVNVPEPLSLAVFGVGLGALGLVRGARRLGGSGVGPESVKNV